MRKVTFAVASLLTATLIGCSALAQSALITKTTDNKIEWAFTKADEHPDQLLIGVINSAKSTLDIAIYSLTHPDIVKAIKDAKARGVAVRVITDEQQAGGKTQAEAIKLLRAAGIPVKLDNHSGLMHLKMTVVDGKIATTGSFNYTKAAATTNDEVLVVLRDPTVAKSFDTEFNRMWNDAKNFVNAR